MLEPQSRTLVTGGAGFIGSHLVRYLSRTYPDHQFVNLDNLTYCGNLHNLSSISDASNYRFVKGSIADASLVASLFEEFDFGCVIHLAAESHVDRSIADPLEFVRTNVLGTATLLNAARNHWSGSTSKRFLHVSTDEVFGSLTLEQPAFTENSSYRPRSPYSASKAAADHLVQAFHETYGLPAMISNCSNNYGPNQFPEKLIPLCIQRLLDGQPIPVYGKGENVRDWLYVEDHVLALEAILLRGLPGESYLVGGNCEVSNLNLVHLLCKAYDEERGLANGTSARSITFVKDRQGHDFRYAINADKLRSRLGWTATTRLEDGLKKTMCWYLQNADWLQQVNSGAYQDFAVAGNSAGQGRG